MVRLPAVPTMVRCVVYYGTCDRIVCLMLPKRRGQLRKPDFWSEKCDTHVVVFAIGNYCMRFRHCLLSNDTVLSGNYDIITEDIEGDMVQVWLENQSTPAHTTKLWKSGEDDSEGIFGMTVEPNQRLALCFQAEWHEAEDDEVATISVVEIGFGLQVHPMPRTLPDEETGPDAQRALDLIQSAISVETDWSNLMDHFSFLRSREATHIKLTNEILDRIMGWTIVEAFVVIFMAVAQVLYWKKFFEQKRYL